MRLGWLPWTSRERNPAIIRRETLSTGLWPDILCSWLLAAGILLGMRQLFRFENPVGMILLRATVVLAVIVLLTRRWWLLASTGLLAALSLAMVGLLGAWDDFWFFVSGLVGWWLNRFPAASYYNTPGNVELVQWIITLAICSLVFLIVRRIQPMAVMAMVVALLFSVIVVVGFRDSYWALLFIGAGLFPLLTRSQYVRHFRTSGALMTPPARVMGMGLAVCLVCALLARLLVPYNTHSWRFQPLNDLWRQLPKTFQQPLQMPFSLEGSGLQPDPSMLGGDIDLPHTPMLEVDSEIRTLFKGTVYGSYTGKGWENRTSADSAAYTFSGDSQFRDIFTLDLPRDSDGGNPLYFGMPSLTSEVRLLRGGYTLFTNGRVTSLELLAANTAPYYNNRGEMFTNTILPINQRYALDVVHLDRTDEAVSRAIAEVERAAMNGGTYNGMPVLGDEAQYARIRETYTDDTERLSRRVRDAADQFRGYDTAYESLAAMEQWFKTSFRYTLKPGSVPEGADFVEYFLETREGYCTYYASAMTMLARSMDIPARFVVGYGLERSGSKWRAYGDTAHAWVECYIRGVGWVVFDPTGGDAGSYMVPGGSVAVPQTVPRPTGTATTNGSTARPSGETTGPSDTQAPGVTTTSPPGGPGGLPVSPLALVLIAAGLALAAAVLLLALRIRARSRRYRLETVRARFPENGAALDDYYTDLLRLLAMLGIRPHTGETIRQHGGRIAETLERREADDAENGKKRQKKGRLEPPFDAGCVTEAFDMVTAWRYGEIPPEADSLERVSRTHGALEAYVRRHMGRVRFFIRRRLL